MAPHSFVLADLFTVTALELVAPDHVHEADPDLVLSPCPACGGEGWLECYGSAWAASCDAWGRPDLNFTYKPCGRCHGEGEVLTLSESTPAAPPAPDCERCQDSGWIDAEPTAKTRAAGFRYLLGRGICPCGAWRAAVDRIAA